MTVRMLEDGALASASIVVISKDEPALATTLEHLEREVAAVVPALLSAAEIVVVDASTRSTLDIQAAHASVRWIPFVRPEGVQVSIPHQRNRGVAAAQGDIVVFTDCGCIPARGWLAHLLGPILSGEERVTCGQTGAAGHAEPYPHRADSQALGPRYLKECPTINLALRRDVLEEVGGFDESFEYGSDVDLSWRAVHQGIPIRYVPEAVVVHDWGNRRRQLKRSFAYGKARARLYAKHVLGRGDQSIRKRRPDERDAVPLLYPLYLLGLPIAARHRWYLALPLVTLWRARRAHPVSVLVDHLAMGAGVLAGTRRLLLEATVGASGERAKGRQG